MNRIALVTDSTCDLPRALLDGQGIHAVPLSVFFGDEEFEDGVQLGPEQFYARLSAAADFPTTSQPPIGKFLALYQQLQKQGFTQILSLHISRKLSGTWQSALAASKMVQGLRLEVMDSGSASWGLGLLALAAADRIQQGVDFSTLLEDVREMAVRTTAYFTVDTLDALQRGGRIGKAAAWIGNHLGIRPILALKGSSGAVELIRKVPAASALAAMTGLVQEHLQEQGLAYGACVLQADAPDRQLAFQEALKASGADLRILRTGSIGPVVGAHLGSGGWGVALC